MVASLFLLVIFLLFLAKLKMPQDIRQKAAGARCFLAIRGSTDNRVKIIEGVGGEQVLNGQSVCVAGLGDHYDSFYQSKIAAEADLNSAYYPCQNAQLKSADHPTVGDNCNVDQIQGKVVCVGGPTRESFICVNNNTKEHHYRLLASDNVLADTLTDEVTVPQASQAADLKFKDWQAIPITLKVGFLTYPASANKNERANYWPELALFLNNGQNYRGAYDTASCRRQTRTHYLPACGRPNQYQDRLIDKFELVGQTNQTIVKHWQFKAGDLLESVGQKWQHRYVTKLSFVFYNDYWPGGNQQRSLAIKFIEFLTPDNQVLLRYVPTDTSYWPDQSKRQPQPRKSFYFDLGPVNDSAKKTATENGFVNAFDKKKLETIDDNQSARFQRWLLARDGSFNLVTEELSAPILNYFHHHQR